MKLPDEMTYGEELGPAMKITDPDKAKEYLKAMVERYMRITDNSREECERVAKVNLGYWAGYYDAETQERVNRLFNTEHPIFGKTQPTPEEAFEAGKRWAEKGTT